MEKKILIVKGESQYNVLRIATDEIAKGFANKGYYVEVLDMLNPKEKILIHKKMTSESYAFIFSCQALRFEDLQNDGTPFLESVKSPYFTWIFDDLLHHLHKVQNQVYDYTYMLSVDEEMQDIAITMYPHLKNIAGLIHGGFCGMEGAVEKDIEVLFPGTISKEPVIEDIIEEPMPVEKLLAEKTIQQLEVMPWLSVRKALEAVMRSLGEEMSGDLLLELSGVILYVDLYFRYQCRYRMMKALLESGVKLHVVGSGTNDLLEQYKDNITVCGAKDITEVVKLIQRSKVVINPFPIIFYKGAHERIFTALLNKAVCFTPYSEYLDDLLGNRVQFIDLKNLDNMVKDVNKALDSYDGEVMQNLLEDNYRYALENHTWEIRGKEIAEFYESIYGE